MTSDSLEETGKKLKDALSAIILEKGYAVLGLPGGRSIKHFFPVLKKLPWQKLHLFMADERLVPVNDKESNFRLLKEGFIDGIFIPKENLHPFIMEKEKDCGAGRYTEELLKYGGFDAAILGVGEDGHVAGLFPNYTINNMQKGFFVFHDSPKPPKDRMTASRKLLEGAKLIALLFVGEPKRNAYNMFFDNKIKVEQCPAKFAIGKSIVYTNWGD